MKNRDAFSGFHPLVNFIYFAAVLIITMFYTHPVFLAISFISAIVYSIYLNGRKAVRFNLLYMIPTFLFIAIINPVFSHAGITILVYVNGHPITFESVVFGLVSAAMFVAIIVWFSCYNTVMTSDKFIYLFGRVIPSLSLILSMTLRFVPRFKEQLLKISDAQRNVGRDVRNGKTLDKLKNAMRILSVMVTWALENSMETADSMKARGYGLKGRTAFSIFRLDSRDKTALLVLGLCIATVVGGMTMALKVQYFPRIIFNSTTPVSIIVYIAFGVICLLPVAIDIWEDAKWRHLQSAA